jgi:hypothetical protein
MAFDNWRNCSISKKYNPSLSRTHELKKSILLSNSRRYSRFLIDSPSSFPARPKVLQNRGYFRLFDRLPAVVYNDESIFDCECLRSCFRIFVRNLRGADQYKKTNISRSHFPLNRANFSPTVSIHDLISYLIFTFHLSLILLLVLFAYSSF